MKYSAMVSSALFRSSSQSPAISKRSKSISRSAVSTPLGSSCRKKLGNDHAPGEAAPIFGGGQYSGDGGGGGGGGGGVYGGSGFG